MRCSESLVRRAGLAVVCNDWISPTSFVQRARGRHWCHTSLIPSSPADTARSVRAVVDRHLERKLVGLQGSSFDFDDEQLDDGDSHAVLADYLRQVIRKVLAA